MRGGLLVLGTTVLAGLLSGLTRVEAKAEPKPAELIETYDTMDQLCGETGSPVSAATACEQRDKLYTTIKAQGWCKGRIGQVPADYRWHACARGSR
jgi:hypothetical protein